MVLQKKGKETKRRSLNFSAGIAGCQQATDHKAGQSKLLFSSRIWRATPQFAMFLLVVMASSEPWSVVMPTTVSAKKGKGWGSLWRGGGRERWSRLIPNLFERTRMVFAPGLYWSNAANVFAPETKRCPCNTKALKRRRKRINRRRWERKSISAVPDIPVYTLLTCRQTDQS